MWYRTARLTVAVVALVLPLAGCSKEPTKWDKADQETRGKPAVAAEAIDGAAFNKFFPKAEAPFSVVYKQEKKGTSIASLQRDGKELATLTVFDTLSNPDATQEYKDSTQALGGYPLVAKGAKGTAVLVNRRFQVQVRSTDDSFGEAERKEWLKKFDLDGLAQLG
jgi:hypothetical protein